MGLAADRGVTICFADLDGADGLWVPEERTILVNRRLPESRVNEVIEHELGHVAIDDQHAALDAGVWQRPAALSGLMSRRWAAPALSAAAFVALVTGVTLGITAATPDSVRKETKDPLPVPTEFGPGPAGPAIVSRSPYVDGNGNTLYRTVTLTPSVPGSPTLTASGSRPPSAGQLASKVPGIPVRTPGATATSGPPVESTPSTEPTPTPEVTTSGPTVGPPPTSEAPAADPSAIKAGG